MAEDRGPIGKEQAVRRPRFRLRTMVVLGALLAVGIGGTLWAVGRARRRAEYLARAEKHAREGVNYRKLAAAAQRGLDRARKALEDNLHEIREEPDAEKKRDLSEWTRYFEQEILNWVDQTLGYRVLAEYHEDLCGYYKDVAEQPWVNVPPEPPEPPAPVKKFAEPPGARPAGTAAPGTARPESRTTDGGR